MAEIGDIVQKQKAYKKQMRSIRQAVVSFAESKGWFTQNRGRKAHLSIYGPVNGLKGVINIVMTENNWDFMPEELEPDTPFRLWSSASLTRDDIRLVADTELFWTVPFSALPETVDRFIVEAWEMLSGLKETNLLEDFPGHSDSPDYPPNFGPPRNRG